MQLTEEEQECLSNMIRVNVNPSECVKYIRKCQKHLTYTNLQLVNYYYGVFAARLRLKQLQDNLPVPDYAYGDRVTFTHGIERDYVPECWSREGGLVKPAYMYYVVRKIQLTEGLFLGHRYVRNGFLAKHNFQQCTEQPTLKVALISVSANTNPIRIAVQGIHKKEQE